MASANKIIIPVVIVAVVLVGGAAAYFLTEHSSSGGKIVEFINQPVQLAEEVDSLESPEESGTVAAHLRRGATVDVVGLVEGRKWAQVTLPDKRTAYVPARLVQSAPPPPLPAAPPPAPGAASSSASPSPEAEAMFVSDQANKVELDPTSDIYVPDKIVQVYVEPNVRAPLKYEIEPGTGVPVIARSRDGVWAMASTEDGSPAFLLIADLGQPRAGKIVPEPAALPDTIDGVAKVLTTSSIDVGGQQVTLFGIQGESGPYAEQLQTVVDSQGGSVHCVRQDQDYVCKLGSGIDIAVSALFNGGARTTSGAPQAYLSQEAAAQKNGRGLWGSNAH